MRSTWKKVTAGIMALSMVTGSVPFEPISQAVNSWTALVANAQNAATTVSTIEQLKSAVGNDGTGGLIQLGEDIISSGSSVDFKKASTLDLNGHNLTLKYLDAYTDLVIQDSVGNGKLTLTDSGFGIGVSNSSSVTIESGTIEFENPGSNGFEVYADDSSLTINGGTITSAGDSIFRYLGAVTINGGSITGGFGSDEDTNDTLSITGGTFSFDVTSLLTDGYTATKDGDFWVVGEQQSTATFKKITSADTFDTEFADFTPVSKEEAEAWYEANKDAIAAERAASSAEFKVTFIIYGYNETNGELVYKLLDTENDYIDWSFDRNSLISGVKADMMDSSKFNAVYYATTAQSQSTALTAENTTVTMAENSADVSSVVVGETTLTDNDYTVTYLNEDEEEIAKPTAIGNYTAVITGQGDYEGSVNVEFSIKISINSAVIKLADNTSDITSVVLGETALDEDCYTVTYLNDDEEEIEKPAEPGLYKVVIEGKGDYCGKRSKLFKIASHPLSEMLYLHFMAADEGISETDVTFAGTDVDITGINDEDGIWLIGHYCDNDGQMADSDLTFKAKNGKRISKIELVLEYEDEQFSNIMTDAAGGIEHLYGSEYVTIYAGDEGAGSITISYNAAGGDVSDMVLTNVARVYYDEEMSFPYTEEITSELDGEAEDIVTPDMLPGFKSMTLEEARLWQFDEMVEESILIFGYDEETQEFQCMFFEQGICEEVGSFQFTVEALNDEFGEGDAIYYTVDNIPLPELKYETAEITEPIKSETNTLLTADMLPDFKPTTLEEAKNWYKAPSIYATYPVSYLIYDFDDEGNACAALFFNGKFYYSAKDKLSLEALAGVIANGMTLFYTTPSEISWSRPEWNWIDNDNISATFTDLDSGETETVEATVKSEIVKEPTIHEEGVIAYTASVTFNGKKYLYLRRFTLDKLTPEYEETTYTWSDDNSTVTAFAKCKNGTSEDDDLTEVVNTTSAVTKKVTCEENGETTYTAEFANKHFETQTKTVDNIPALGHSYCEPVFTWTDDFTATAEFTCGNCGDKQTIEATVESKTLEPTYTTAGKTAYRATVVFDGKTYTDTKTVNLPKLDYTAPTISYTPGNGRVKLDWTAVEGAEKYAVCGLVNGEWKVLAQGTSTSYIIDNLTAGKNYKVTVIAKMKGEWVNTASNAITVTPNATPYPDVTAQSNGKQFKLNWTAVKGAEAYGVAVKTSEGWKVIKADITPDTLTYISPANKTETGTYYVAVCTKINGKWDTSNIQKSMVEVTITGEVVEN